MESLAKHWVHSHEEDREGETVFRPPSFPFPRSRGRKSIELKPDGSLIEGGPGPTDRPESSQGKWTATGNTLVLKKPGHADRQYEIASASTDKLVLKEKSS